MMTFADRLKELRLARGLSVDEVARRTGFHFVNVYEYERGAVTPTLANLLRLCKALGCDLSAFNDCAMPKDGRRRKRAKVPA